MSDSVNNYAECRICGRPLGRSASVKRGIGPICWRRLQLVIPKVLRVLGREQDDPGAVEEAITIIEGYSRLILASPNAREENPETDVDKAAVDAYNALSGIDLPFADRLAASAEWRHSPQGKYRLIRNRRESIARADLRAKGVKGTISSKKLIEHYWEMFPEEKAQHEAEKKVRLQMRDERIRKAAQERLKAEKRSNNF